MTVRNWGGFLRDATKRPTRGVTPSDAAGSLPAAPQDRATGNASDIGASPDYRSKIFGTLRNMGTVFADARRLIPGAGANWYSRIFRWIEIEAHTEGGTILEQASNGNVVVDPRDNTNFVVTLQQDAKFIFPVGYGSIDGSPALLDVSDVESLVQSAQDRCRFQPRTILVRHNGFKIVQLGILPDGTDIPQDIAGVTGFTIVYTEWPGYVSTWRVTGFSHWPQ